jgi:hypothetical protein
MAPLVEQHVARLHVAMDEAALVRGVECARDLREHLDRPLGRELPVPLEGGTQVGALHVPHRQVELALVLARLVDRNHVRVVERGRELRLTEEALPEVGVLHQLGCDQLQRHRPLERGVMREIDHAHTAAPEERLNAIVRERCARGERCLHGALLRVRGDRTIALPKPRMAERDGARRAVPRLEQTWPVFRHRLQ